MAETGTQVAGLTKKAQRALEVLATGGYFRKQLESAYKGGEQFRTRLRASDGHVVKGYGFQTHRELEAAGLLARRECASSSVWPTEWVVRQ